MTDTLYDSDPVRWSDEQAAALRRLALSSASNSVDWENVIEEVESVGRSQRQAVDSLLINALTHLLKMAGDPDSLSVRAWSREVKAFLDQVRMRATGAIRADLNLDALWREAVLGAGMELREYGRALPPALPETCPFRLADLLDPAKDARTLSRQIVSDPDRP